MVERHDASWSVGIKKSTVKGISGYPEARSRPLRAVSEGSRVESGDDAVYTPQNAALAERGALHVSNSRKRQEH